MGVLRTRGIHHLGSVLGPLIFGNFHLGTARLSLEPAVGFNIELNYEWGGWFRLFSLLS